MNIWITSDEHYRHKGICRGTSPWEDKSSCRDFNTTEEMDECILNNQNELVKEDDLLIKLGDNMFGQNKMEAIAEYRAKTRCKTIWFSRGNHDPQNIKDKVKDDAFLAELSKIFGSPVIDYRVVSLLGKLWIFHHYALLCWLEQNHQSLHCYAHSHGRLKAPLGLRSRDIGVDANPKGYYPFNLEDVRDELVKVERISYDHH